MNLKKYKYSNTLEFDYFSYKNLHACYKWMIKRVKLID